MRSFGAGGLAVAAALVASPAAAQLGVDVTGGGLATACAQAARDGQTEPRFEKICSDSLEREMLVPLDRAGTYVNRGIIKLRGQRYDEAIKDFDIAIRYRASLAEAYVNRGAAQIGAHRFAAAVSDLDNALMLNVKEPEKAYYNRAVADEWLNDFKAAYLDYKKAVEIAPDWDLPRQQLGRFTVSHPIEALPVVQPLSETPK